MENNKQENFKERMKEVYNLIEEKLSYIPEKLRIPIQKELDMIKKLIIDSRAPRFAFVGRRGAGKSNLLNAIFGSEKAKTGDVVAQTIIGKWYNYKNKNGSMEILDTRGLNEGKNPQKALEDVKLCLDDKLPDAFIFLNKATEVDAHINTDIESLCKLYGHVTEKYSYEIPIITVATQSDQMNPSLDNKPPYKEKKLKNLDKAIDHLNNKVNEKIPNNTYKIAVSSLMEFDEKGKITIDYRWNIDKLIELLLEHIPQSAQLELAKIGQMKTLQKKIARKIEYSAATICSAIAFEPLPIADMPLITGVQLSMIIGIGYIGGYELNKETAKEFLSAMGLNVGGAFLFRELARGLIKLIPGFGSFISSAIAFASTIAIGEAAIAYFIGKKSKEETKSIYDKKYKELKDKK